MGNVPVFSYLNERVLYSILHIYVKISCIMFAHWPNRSFASDSRTFYGWVHSMLYNCLYIHMQAIRDGVIEATIDHEQGFMQSKVRNESSGEERERERESPTYTDKIEKLV